MNNKLILVLTVVAGAFSIDAQASCNKYDCEGVTNVLLTSVKANSEGVYARFPEGTTDTLSCSLLHSTDAKLNPKSPNYRNMQSMLLTAVASNLPLKLTFNSGLQVCEIESVEIKVVE